jgi:hypothetical protein
MTEKILLNSFDLEEIKKKGFVEWGVYVIATKELWKKKREII